ncbi:hypothetical protein ACQJBY_021459 [Aegilops geniculata]
MATPRFSLGQLLRRGSAPSRLGAPAVSRVVLLSRCRRAERHLLLPRIFPPSDAPSGVIRTPNKQWYEDACKGKSSDGSAYEQLRTVMKQNFCWLMTYHTIPKGRGKEALASFIFGLAGMYWMVCTHMRLRKLTRGEINVNSKWYRVEDGSITCD